MKKVFSKYPFRVASFAALALLSLQSCEQTQFIGQQSAPAFDDFFETVEMEKAEVAQLRQEIQKFQNEGHELKISIMAALSDVENTTTLVPIDDEVKAVFERWNQVEAWYYSRIRKGDFVCIDPAYVYSFEVLDKDGKSLGFIATRSIYKADDESRSVEDDLIALSKAPRPQAGYVKKARSGDAKAQVLLGDDYMDGDFSVAKNMSKAVYWWKKAAAQNESTAFARLGDYYINKRKYVAADYYKRGAKLGDANAQLGLARCYRDGVGVEKNLQKALQMYVKASDQGDTEAAYDLGIIYRDGLGDLKPDKENAKAWLRKAAVHGKPKAQEALEALMSSEASE